MPQSPSTEGWLKVWLCLTPRVSCPAGPLRADVSAVGRSLQLLLVQVNLETSLRSAEGEGDLEGVNIHRCVTFCCSSLGRRIRKPSYFAFGLFEFVVSGDRVWLLSSGVVLELFSGYFLTFCGPYSVYCPLLSSLKCIAIIKIKESVAQCIVPGLFTI